MINFFYRYRPTGLFRPRSWKTHNLFCFEIHQKRTNLLWRKNIHIQISKFTLYNYSIYLKKLFVIYFQRKNQNGFLLFE